MQMLKTRVFERDLEGEHALSLARRKAIRQRQMTSEKAAAMARDIEVKKKVTKVNPAKQWEKDKKRREKERLRQNDTDSVVSVPNSVDSTERYESDIPRMDGVGNRAVEEENRLEKDDKKQKKKDKKQKKKNKLFIEAAAASQRTYSDDLHSPDIENEFEIVDKISMSSASPTKSMKGKYTTSSDKDNTSEDMLDVRSSKKKKKDKKKKSKGKEKDFNDGLEDTESVLTMPGGVMDGSDSKRDSKKDKKKKGKKKEKSLSVEEHEFDDSSSIVTMQSIASEGKKKDKKKDKQKKKSKDVDMGDSLPGMVRDDSLDRNVEDDAVSIQSMSKKDKKKEKKDKKDKKKFSGKEHVNVKGNGSIPNESASDGNISSPTNLSDFEVVERYKPPSEASKRGSDKRKGHIYSEDDLQSQWTDMPDFGPIPEIPSFDELRERRLSKEREEEEKRKRLSPKSEPTTPSGGSGTKQAWGGARIQHSYSNGMDPNGGLAQTRNISITDTSITDTNTNVTKTHVNQIRDYFDYGTTV